MNRTEKSEAGKRRQLKPREPVYISPALVSQLTCLAVLGVDPRRYLEELATRPDIPRMRRGKLVLSDPRDWQRALTAVVASDAAAIGHEVDDGGTTLSVDDILASLGRRRIAGAR